MRKILHILSIFVFNVCILHSNGIAQKLYVGANYHPHDLTAKEWKRDVALMKALAFSFPSQIASSYFPEQHQNQLQSCFDLFYNRNMDARIVEISRSQLNYKLLFVPDVAVMDEVTAKKIRDFVKNDGTVVMTSNSAIVDESGQVFATTHPGHLSDVFGIRIGSYEEIETLNEIPLVSLRGKKLEFTYKGKTVQTESARFDVIDLKGAEILGSITSLDKDYPIITSHKFGKGRAIYFGLPAEVEILNLLTDDLIKELSIRKGPDTPAGVMAKQIDPTHILYLNVTGEEKEILMNKTSHSVLRDRDYNDAFTIAPYEPEFIEIH